MQLTNKQKMLLHRVPAALGVDEAQRRIIQRNVGGFYSAADKTAGHVGFAAVMAYYEARSSGKLAGFTAGYWQAAHERNQQTGSTERLVWRIRQEAATLGWDDVRIEAFLSSDRMSSGACVSLTDASIYWLRKCLQGLIEIHKRARGEVA